MICGGALSDCVIAILLHPSQFRRLRASEQCHKETPLNDFGLLIAYVLPGFVALWGFAVLDPDLEVQMLGTGNTQPTIAGFLFSTVAAVAAGLTISTIRWLMIDAIHQPHLRGGRRSERQQRPY